MLRWLVPLGRSFLGASQCEAFQRSKSCRAWSRPMAKGTTRGRSCPCLNAAITDKKSCLKALGYCLCGFENIEGSEDRIMPCQMSCLCVVLVSCQGHQGKTQLQSATASAQS